MALVSPSFCETFQHSAEREDWVWDPRHKSPAVVLSRNQHEAYFHIDPVESSRGTAAVRGTKGFAFGSHYWEVEFEEPPLGTSVMIGVGTGHALLHLDDYRFTDLIGIDDQSWGLSYKGQVVHAGVKRPYCEPFYLPRTVIGVHLDRDRGTLEFTRDGRALGVAFTGLEGVAGPLYPLVSSTTALTELRLGFRASRYGSLRERCCLAVREAITRRGDVGALPLPRLLRELVQDAVC